MSTELCNECQPEKLCKYEGYINETAQGINILSSQEEIRRAMATISYLEFRAATKRDRCPKYDELRTLSASLVVLDKNQGQKSKSSTK